MKFFLEIDEIFFKKLESKLKLSCAFTPTYFKTYFQIKVFLLNKYFNVFNHLIWKFNYAQYL